MCSHNFGRSVPPPIKSLETLKQKMNLLDAMADVELAQSILKETANDDTHNLCAKLLIAAACNTTHL